jgi:hypothetical protein
MTGLRRLVPGAVLLSALLLAACGGGTTEEAAPTRAKPLPAAVVARADANCRYFLRATKRIGERALAEPRPTTVAELTTERLVKPSIPLLERVAKRQQALEQSADDPRFARYAELFDPIVVLAGERLASGRAGDTFRSRELEELLTTLGLDQRQAVRELGLGECDLDFQRILLSSLNE